jgi:hypothetical protein
MIHINMLLLSLFLFQGGNRIQIENVQSQAAIDFGQMIYKAFGSFSIEPFDIKDRDAYVLLVSNANNTLALHETERFTFSKVNVLTFNWNYSFTIEKPQDDFNVYAILVDRFSDDHKKALEAEMKNMESSEEVITYLRKTDRIDPLNFAVFWVRVN